MTRNARVLAAVVATMALTAMVGVGSRPSAAAPATAISLDPAAGPPTAVTTVTGTGFKGREAVTLSVDGARVGSTTADKHGRLVTVITVPGVFQPGPHVISAVGLSSRRSATARFTVDYEGRTIAFCCKDCIKDFKKDPDKFVKKMDEEKAAKKDGDKPAK